MVGSLSLVIVTVAVCGIVAVCPAGITQRTGIVLFGGIVKLVSEQLVVPAVQPLPVSNVIHELPEITAADAVNVPTSIVAEFCTVTDPIGPAPPLTAFGSGQLSATITAFMPDPDSVTALLINSGSFDVIVSVVERAAAADGFIVIVHCALPWGAIFAGRAGPPVIVKS